MVGSNGTMLAIRLVRSKLRKREDHSNTVHPEPAVVQTAAAPVPASASPSSNGALQSCDAMPPHCTDLGPSTDPELAYTGQFVWQFPPPYPPPHTPPPQYSLYNNDQVRILTIGLWPSTTPFFLKSPEFSHPLSQ